MDDGSMKRKYYETNPYDYIVWIQHVTLISFIFHTFQSAINMELQHYLAIHRSEEL